MQTTERAHGIILRTRPLTETSLIVNWLTPGLGRISTVAKGARRTKSPYRGKMDLFYEADFNFQRSRRSELHTLREIVLRETNASIRTELGYLQQASYCATLIEQTTETQTPLPDVYELFRGLIHALPNQPPKPRMVFAFELKLLEILGLAPNVGESRLSPDARTLVSTLTGTNWDELPALQATPAQATAIKQFLHGFLIYHLGRIPKGREQAVTLNA